MKLARSDRDIVGNSELILEAYVRTYLAAGVDPEKIPEKLKYYGHNSHGDYKDTIMRICRRVASEKTQQDVAPGKTQLACSRKS